MTITIDYEVGQPYGLYVRNFEFTKTTKAWTQKSNQFSPNCVPPPRWPQVCYRVVELGRLGKSRAWIASELNVSRDTLDEWERQYSEFSDAMDELPS